MCGFIGEITKEKSNYENIRIANKPIVCRGPDNTSEIHSTNHKLFNDTHGEYNISWIFNRLSILELSELGNQPMISMKYKTMMMFNGEIYNYKELKADLIKEGVKFNSHNSDSEVLLLGLSHYGIKFLDKLIGQFSIVFFDYKKNDLYLIRDRLGQKPLFYNIHKNKIIFSSNLKSIYNLENNHKISNRQLVNYINFGVVPSPKSIFEDISKVLPGTFIKVNLDNFSFEKTTYWSPRDYINSKQFNEDKFFDLFSKSIEHRLVSDVPIANFLSGGLDSTSIVKSQFDNKSDNINTFTIGVDDQKYDESGWAELVSKKYQTNHTLVNINSKFDNDIILESISAFDELYSDPSTVLSYQISKVISKNYKVAISGDGGDELLGGYKRTNLMLKRNTLPNSFVKFLNKIYPKHYGSAQEILYRNGDAGMAYSSFFEDINLLNLLDLNPTDRYCDLFFEESGNDYKNLLLSDYKFYLPEMMMLKVDRSSMANSLEVRSPFVDHKLVEYILSTESNFIDIGPKSLLKRYLKSDFDYDFLNRKKQGFVFDLENWVYKNIDLIHETINSGEILNNLNKDIVNILSKRKTRVNALRIWKLFILEKYLGNLKIKN